MVKSHSENLIIRSTEILQDDELDRVKKILTSINKDFKVENILTINQIIFDFDIEIPQDDNFIFPRSIASYTPNSKANLLDIFNDIIWLYLSSKKDFNEKLEQFEKFVELSQQDKKYDHLSSLVDQMEILDEMIFNGDCIEKNFRKFQNNFYSQYGIDLKEYLERKVFEDNGKEDFNEKLKQFEKFIQLSQQDKKYKDLNPLADQIEILDEIIRKSDSSEKNFKEFQNNFHNQYDIDLKKFITD